MAHPSNALPLEHQLNDGRYTIRGLLGAGGFGLTYRAADNMLRREVAIKELYPDGCERKGATITLGGYYDVQRWEKAVADFLREARTLAGISDEGVVQVHDFFRENETAYMVMELIEGESLATKSQISEAEALRYTVVVGEALIELHRKKVLHRDVKPSNIMLKQGDRPVLIDFGAARELLADVPITQVHIGTPAFSAPEQFLPDGRLDERTDVYGLAGTCYYLITGEKPNKSKPAENSKLSPNVRAALARALASDPDKRQPSVASFLTELQFAEIDKTTILAEGRSTPSRQAQPDQPAPRESPAEIQVEPGLTGVAHPQPDDRAPGSPPEIQLEPGLTGVDHPQLDQRSPRTSTPGIQVSGLGQIAILAILCCLLCSLALGVWIARGDRSGPGASPSPATPTAAEPSSTPALSPAGNQPGQSPAATNTGMPTGIPTARPTELPSPPTELPVPTPTFSPVPMPSETPRPTTATTVPLPSATPQPPSEAGGPLRRGRPANNNTVSLYSEPNGEQSQSLRFDATMCLQINEELGDWLALEVVGTDIKGWVRKRLVSLARQPGCSP